MVSEGGSELPATAWTVLGLLSFGTDLSGYDLKKWADNSLRFFYWSPAASQIYAELRRLERLGYATSTVASEGGGPGGFPSPKGDPPNAARSCSDAHADRSGPPGTTPVGLMSRCTT